LSPERVLDAVERAMLRPWQWGIADCSASACTAFADLWGVDPMAPLRGAYHTAEGAGDVIAEYLGFEAMAVALARSAGLTAVEHDEPGAIGVIAAGPRMGTLGICIQPRAWAIKSPRGYGVRRAALRRWTWRR